MIIRLPLFNIVKARHLQRVHTRLDKHTIFFPQFQQTSIVEVLDYGFHYEHVRVMLNENYTELSKLMHRPGSPMHCTIVQWCNGELRESALSYLHTRQNISDMHFISSISSDKFGQWWLWDGVMYKQTNTICKPKSIRLFSLVTNFAIIILYSPN